MEIVYLSLCTIAAFTSKVGRDTWTYLIFFTFLVSCKLQILALAHAFKSVQSVTFIGF